MALAAALYAVFVAYPLVLNRRARDSRDPYFTAVLGSVFFFFAARSALLGGGLQAYIGIIPVAEGVVMALVLQQLLRVQPAEERDLGRLAVVAAASLSFATVAIPLQLDKQWITIGWALEGAALSWLYRRVPHKGLLYSASALLAVVFVRLALNPEIFLYEPRGSMRIVNWYLYTYLTWRRGHVGGRMVAVEDRRSDRSTPPARVVSAAGRRGHRVVRPVEHRGGGFLRHRPRDRVPVRRHGRSRPDLHAVLAGLRARPADVGDLPAQIATRESPPSRSSP